MTFWFFRPGQEVHFDLEVGGAVGPKQLSPGTAERGPGGTRVTRDYKQVKARGGGYREQG